MTALRLLRSFMSLAMAACLAFAGVAACMGALRTPAEAATGGLTIWVGYTQGPYYKKAYFTDAQLRAMSDGVTYEYSALDSAHYLRKGFAKGVTLQRLLSAAGIDEGAMWRFYLGTSDTYVEDAGDYGTNGEAWYYRNLVNTPRYYYSELCANAQFEGESFEKILPGAENAVLQSAVGVPSILAFESAFSRVYRFDDPHWESQLLSSNDGYRLMFGQTSPTDVTARDSAMAVSSITCILGGSDGRDIPVVEVGDELIDAIKNANVGDTLTFAPGLSNVMDELVASEGWKHINLVSETPDVLEVRQNANGTWSITIKDTGQATLSYSYGNGGEGFHYEGSTALECGYGNGDGDGTGSGSGTGTGNGADNGAGANGPDSEGSASGAGNEDGAGSGGQEGNQDGGASGDEEASFADAEGEAGANEESALVTFGEDVVMHAASFAAPVQAAAAEEASAAMEEATSEEDEAGGSSGSGDMSALPTQTFSLILDDEAPLAEEEQPLLPAGMWGSLALCLMFGGIRKAASFQLAKDDGGAVRAHKEGGR